MDNAQIRAMHRSLEAYHGMIYFVPEASAAYADLGIHGRMGYFASRSAAMGPVGPETVISTFFNFNPELVYAALPKAWSLASPEQLLAARIGAADSALRRVLGDAVEGSEIAEAAELAKTATSGCYLEGHPLYAGHAAQDWPTQPHLVLWWALTLLREFRGDGHIAAMTTQGLSGIEALVIHQATGALPPGTLQTTRAWSDEAWAAGVASVQNRGWLNGAGELTKDGLAARQWVEDCTDELTAGCWEPLGEEGCARLRELARPLVKALLPELPGGGNWLKKP
ncbi:hypothetical protein CLV47_108110 [Antricoccus suffuscus]|uniref:SalK n=1 Tax=Antricoccus suffuscus TaxID=1629062 RepID=A0A2T0ZZG9_9ACTN|nr:hypothetical protein [Antricoccus suffuscus]PRZ41751.1 hypothetical protein CLV47_108110 [Antricoccus suffuscus]